MSLDDLLRQAAATYGGDVDQDELRRRYAEVERAYRRSSARIRLVDDARSLREEASLASSVESPRRTYVRHALDAVRVKFSDEVCALVAMLFRHRPALLFATAMSVGALVVASLLTGLHVSSVGPTAEATSVEVPSMTEPPVDNGERGQTGTECRLPEVIPVTFAPDSAVLGFYRQAVISEVASKLIETEPDVHFTLVGHALSAEGTPEEALTLSRQRAAAVRTQLVASGVAADRVTTIGVGAHRPAAACHQWGHGTTASSLQPPVQPGGLDGPTDHIGRSVMIIVFSR